MYITLVLYITYWTICFVGFRNINLDIFVCLIRYGVFPGIGEFFYFWLITGLYAANWLDCKETKAAIHPSALGVGISRRMAVEHRYIKRCIEQITVSATFTNWVTVFKNKIRYGILPGHWGLLLLLIDNRFICCKLIGLESD